MQEGLTFFRTVQEGPIVISGGRSVYTFVATQFYFHVNGSIGIVQKIDFEIRPDLG